MNKNTGDEDSEFFNKKNVKIVKHHIYKPTNMFPGVIGVVEFEFWGFEIISGQRLGVFKGLYFAPVA